MAISYLPTRRGYAYAVLLPIWEKWTDSHPAMRRFLEDPGADPDGHEERLHSLVRAAADLRRPGRDDPGALAAWLAVAACLKASIGVPERDWRDALERAVAADLVAGATAAGQMAGE